MWKIGITLFCCLSFACAERLKAKAVLRNPATGIDGLVTFVETDDGILINGNITGLKPGNHGFHVHEKGDISKADCTSAGPHFNPFNTAHGKPDDSIRHVGDLGNIEVPIDGKVTFGFTDKNISFSGATNIIGRTLVIHADPDDFGRGTFDDSKTTGHAGARLACGIIEGNAAAKLLTSPTLLGSLLLLVIFIIRN